MKVRIKVFPEGDVSGRASWVGAQGATHDLGLYGETKEAFFAHVQMVQDALIEERKAARAARRGLQKLTGGK